MAASDPVSSRELLEPDSSSSEGGAWLVPLPSSSIALPADCACCGELAARELRLSDGERTELLVGYCEACASHIARDATRRLAATLSSLLLGLSLAAALPIVFPWQSRLACLLAAGFGALLPLLLGRLGRRVEPGHAATGRAVWFRAPAELACLRGAFAAEVAERAGSEAQRVRASRSLPWAEALLVSGVAAVLAPFSHAFHHPSVRILDLGPTAIALRVDGRPVGRVEPSSGESPLAGLELRLPAGERTLQAVDTSGAVVGEARVKLQAGGRHLYAPGALDICFWLETMSYGREQKRPDYAPLGGDERFWVVPEQVSGWFMPSPPVPEGARATGGTSTVLRQAPCEDVPYSR